ncbi:Transposon Ty3-G Gag-Pol polyprotein [Trichinella nativa]|uniref:RNA-directed DNA polymerase n=1 Tax=Trichinella nativa TaxID=6335 RepID=A0A0V1KMD3_9BILA|nr:Transposon Ty3-G Gag-Pol polyprotein [Trichinella nativa]
MERYFRAADVPDNRRAAMVQYHMDEAMGDVLSALEVEETDDYDKLKSTLFRVFVLRLKAFPQLKDQADGILLQQFEAGIRQDMIKFTILRSAPDSFEKAVKIAAREDLMINHVTAATASASVVTTAADVKKETARMKAKQAGEITARTKIKAVSPRRRRQRSDRFTCWTCGQLGHISLDCHSHTGSQHSRDDPQSRVMEGSVGSLKCKMLVDTGAAVTVAAEDVMKGSKVGILCGLTAAPRTWSQTVRIRQSSIPFTKPIAVAAVGTKSANNGSQIFVAMEQMLPKEQEAGRKYRLTLSAILEQFSDVLATSDEDLGQTSVIRHAIHTGHAKPVEMETRDREKTAFTTPYGLYQFKVMPFGLCNAPATFQRLMETSLRGLVGSKCLVYLDDEVIDRLRKVGLKVKHEKSQLMKRKVAHLGHINSEKGIATDPSKTRARLLEGEAEWKWTEDCQVAFDALKHQLTSAPILAYPDFRRRFLVDVDASGDGLGAVLSQKDGSKERVVAYASRSLTKPERRYCVTRREMLGLVWALREFRPYLYGQRFLVRTDHSCLRWLRNFKEPEGQVARWLESLAELDFEVEHRPGRLHGNADALSRTSCAQCGRPMKSSMCAVRAVPSGSAVVAQTLRDQLLAAQQADPEIQLLRQWVTSGPWPTQCPHEYSRDLKMMWQQGPVWIVQEDLICRHRNGLTAEEGATQVLVPRALRSEIMRSLHNSRYAGHLGERRTLSRTRSRFYWPGMSGDVHLWCRTCTQCAARKRPEWEWTCFGHWKRPRLETDIFTKWTVAFPPTNMDADTVAKVLMEKYIAYIGALDCLHSDQGRSFEARVIRELYRLFDIKMTRPSSYHPQGNGQAERFNRILLDMMSSMCEENRQQWDEVLSFVMLSYNSSVNESTGVTPAIAIFGRELKLPLDIQMGSPQRNDTETLPNYIRQTRERIDIVHEQMRRQLKVQQRRQKSLYDRKATQGTFRVNDLVCTNRGPHTYRVRHQERRRRTMVVHSDRLKKYVTQEDADETRRRPFPLWYGSGTYPKEQQPKENEAELGHAGGSYHRSLSKTAEP